LNCRTSLARAIAPEGDRLPGAPCCSASARPAADPVAATRAHMSPPSRAIVAKNASDVSVRRTDLG
jgi:hypothetical protein